MPKSFLVLTPQMVRFNSEKNMKTRKYSLASLLLFSNKVQFRTRKSISHSHWIWPIS